MTTTNPGRLEKAPHFAGRVLDAQLHLLDRQILDADGVPVTTVDDLELDGHDPDQPMEPGAPAPWISALLFGGRAPASRLLRVPWSAVSKVGTVLSLGVRAESLDASWTERWVRDHIIARIPGGQHDPR